MKSWYRSKTVITNLLMSVAVLIQAVTGEAWLDAEAQGAIIVVVNLALRVLTNKGLGK